MTIKMGTAYEADIIAWANEQAALLRSRNFTALDIEHIADEIEDVGKSEIREFSSRMVVLLTHLLKWQFKPSHRAPSWEKTIKAQRKEIEYSQKVTPRTSFTLQREEQTFVHAGCDRLKTTP